MQTLYPIRPRQNPFWFDPKGFLPLFDRRQPAIHGSEVMLIEGEGNYTIFHCLDGRKLLVSKTLRTYEKLVAEDSSFFRVHKRYLVNLQHIKEYDLHSENIVRLKNGKTIEVARRRKANFQTKANAFLCWS